MLDIEFIRDNSELVQEKANQKNSKVDVKKLLGLDKNRRELLLQIEELRADRNKLSFSKDKKPTDAEIAKATKLKNEIAGLEKKLEPIDKEFWVQLKLVPNIPTDDVPVGRSEKDNKVERVWGEKKEFDFKPKTHWQIGQERDLLDKERAAKVSGSRFVYLKGGLARLQFALIQYVINTLGDEKIIHKLIQANHLDIVAKPFEFILPPMMMKTEVYEATSRLNAKETTYKLADDDLWLIASAEHTMCPMYMDEIIDESKLPLRYLAYSTSFRREAGTYGKDTNGIIRLHHFDKLEMEVFSSPETGLDEHFLLIAIQEYLVQQLEIPYELILKSTADIGDPNARGVDINSWFPGQGQFIETHTADFMSDYQARSLKTKLRTSEGKTKLVHTNDATAFALGRILAAIIENYQTHDGHVIVPEVLKPYLNGQEEI